MRKTLVGMALAAIMSTVLATTALAAGTLTNRSFENGTYVPNSLGYETLVAGSPTATAMAGWTVVSGSVDWVGAYWQAKDGSLSLDMSGDGPGAISQAFPTAPNATYTVGFWMSGNPDAGTGAKTMTVSATGNPPVAYTYTVTSTNSRANMAWAFNTYTFVATAPTTTLTFTSTTNSAYGPALDGLRLPMREGMAEQCKNGGWRNMHDGSGHQFRNQGACVSSLARNGAGLDWH